MPAYKVIGGVGVTGFLYIAGAKLLSKVSPYIEMGTPLPERPARYTPGGPSPLTVWSSSETALPVPHIPQNVTSTITPPSTQSSSWTMILLLWSTVQSIIHFLTEQCGEFVAELAVHLLFAILISYFGNYIEQVLRKVLGHPKPTIIDDHSSPVWIMKPTLHELENLADKIQDRINNLEATMVYIIDGAMQTIQNLCAELSHAKKTITELEEALEEMTTARNQLQEQASNYLENSRLIIKQWKEERAEMSTKHDDEMKVSQTKLKDIGEKFDRLLRQLSDSSEKISSLESQLQSMDNDSAEPMGDEHTETEEDNKRIAKLKIQLKYWQTQYEAKKADTDKALATTKANAAERRQEIANVGAVAEIKQLKGTLEKTEDELNLVKKQSEDEIIALKKALAKKEEEVDEPASSSALEKAEEELKLAKKQSDDEITALRETLAKKEEDVKSASSLALKEKDDELKAVKKQSDDAIAALREALAKKEEDDNSAASLALKEKEDELDRVKKQSADEITALKEALLKKKEDDKPAPSFNPAAADFKPSPVVSSHSAHSSTPHTSLPATPFLPSPAAAPFSPSPSSASFSPTPSDTALPPSPSPYPPTPYQQPPTKKDLMPEHARRNLNEINRRLDEERKQKMVGKPAEDEKPEPLSEEELDRRTEQLVNAWKPIQPFTPPAQPALPPPPNPSTPTPSASSPSPTSPPPTFPSAPTPTPSRRHNTRGLKPGAPGTPPIEWPAAPPPPVEGAPTGPRAMRENGGRPPGIPAPAPRGGGRGDGRRGGRERPQLPAHLREMLAKQAEERREEGGK